MKRHCVADDSTDCEPVARYGARRLRSAERLLERIHHGKQSPEVIAPSATGHLGMAAPGQVQLTVVKAAAPCLSFNLTQVRHVTRHDQTFLHFCHTLPRFLSHPASRKAARSELGVRPVAARTVLVRCA